MTLSLIERCRGGDAQAIEMFVREHQTDIYRLALAVLGDPAEAEAAAVAAFLHALRSLPSYRGDRSPLVWLFAITLDVSRQRARRRWLGGGWTRAFTNRARPPAATWQAGRAGDAWPVVQALSEALRLPALLRYYFGLSAADIARVLGLKPTAAHARLTAARERLRQSLAGFDG